ncbi:hypothetical protein PPBDW_I10083 [Photobacterium kishitanii]|nr:hypothetical protein PPBDW_I10083 [Photobacterium kishitanii]
MELHSIYHNDTDVKKPRHYCRGFLEDGRGGEIRTPNTRIWNPLLCQLELHPCSYFKDLTMSLVMAEWTGLEPATPGVTGRYSNQLNYHSAVSIQHKCNLLSLPFIKR